MRAATASDPRTCYASLEPYTLEDRRRPTQVTTVKLHVTLGLAMLPDDFQHCLMVLAVAEGFGAHYTIVIKRNPQNSIRNYLGPYVREHTAPAV